MNGAVVDLDAFRDAKPKNAAFAHLRGGAGGSLADGIGSSYGRLTYKGKVWSLVYRGETHMFLRADDGSPSSYVDVVILRSAPTKSKSFYANGYDDGSNKPPDCASMDGIKPDPGVASPQASVCHVCPRNVWKTDDKGRRGRECSDYKRLAVMLLPAVTKKMLGASLLEPVFLRVPPASLQDLALVGDAMDRKGFPYPSFVMRIMFDPAESYPKFVYKPIQEITDAEAPTVLAMRDDSTALRITGEDLGPRVVPAQVTQVASTAPQVAQQVAPAASQVVVLELEKNAAGAFSTPEEPAAQPVQGQVQAGATTQTAEDVGETDSDLDKRIADLLKTAS